MGHGRQSRGLRANEETSGPDLIDIQTISLEPPCLKGSRVSAPYPQAHLRCQGPGHVLPELVCMATPFQVPRPERLLLEWSRGCFLEVGEGR